MSILGHDRKTVYHSDLRKACEAAEHGCIRIRLLGRHARVLDSQYKDKGPYCPFVVDGEAKSREYQVENDEIRAVLNAAPEGVPVWIRAKGAAGEEEVELWTVDGNRILPGKTPPASEPPLPPPAPPADDPPVRRHEAGPGAPDAGDNGRGNGCRRYDRKTPISHEYWAALMNAHEIVQAYQETFGYPPAPAVTAIAATLLIEYNKSGASRPFGTSPIRKPGDKEGVDPKVFVGYRSWEIPGEDPDDAPPPSPKGVQDERDLPPWPGKYGGQRKGPVEAMADASAAAKRASPFDDEDDDLPF